MFLKERAKAANFIDKAVGSPLVNIYDDPSLPGAFGSYFFDDEGMMCRSTQIVENGIFRRGITDFYSASALGIPRSANGRRQDYSRKAYARMSNTFFGAGTSTLEDMLAQVDHGIYLDKWSSGMEDPKGWGIQVTCHYGHEIKGGKITNRVFAPIGISGYVPDVLGSISAVSKVLKLDGGGCGKGHKEMIPGRIRRAAFADESEAGMMLQKIVDALKGRGELTGWSVRHNGHARGAGVPCRAEDGIHSVWPTRKIIASRSSVKTHRSGWNTGHGRGRDHAAPRWGCVRRRLIRPRSWPGWYPTRFTTCPPRLRFPMFRWWTRN